MDRELHLACCLSRQLSKIIFKEEAIGGHLLKGDVPLKNDGSERGQGGINSKVGRCWSKHCEKKQQCLRYKLLNNA